MELYDRDINVFERNLRNFNLPTDYDKIQLFDYCNDSEKKTIFDLISQYQSRAREETLERIHNILEIEKIFEFVWTLDERECVYRILSFDSASVYGSSFMIEFVKRIKTIASIEAIIDSMEFRNLYGVMAIKFFKSKHRASEYFRTFMDNVKNVPGVNFVETQNQLDRFLSIFPN